MHHWIQMASYLPYMESTAWGSGSQQLKRRYGGDTPRACNGAAGRMQVSW